ncbi:MAG: UvrD-helicase domain-containing protein [Deltaproteobacteria bacterium]|nr:UvrD-helicase domain-containing protein [Deltaproteobacteria bacterium]
MDETFRFEPPQITDEDIAWVCDVLKLPKTAFSGPDGKDPRLEVLKAAAPLDVEACPGSGKTTLLVAKLAILARKWTEPRRGVCVLSHTNVARREIEKRLGNTAAGQRLLTYPHFVGTIHGFANEFLAMPWLRSLGYPIRVIDNHHCEQHRRRLLTLGQFSALASYVNQKEASDPNGKLNIVSKWRVVSPAFEVLKENGEPEFKDATKLAAKQLCALARKCAGDGYHRFDEMFMWGHDLLKNILGIRDAIRQRFPMLFIDEVQDNNEDQSVLLFKLFMNGDSPTIRQRYGDSNQAIYTYAGDAGATTDLFPDRSIRKDIPNSHRFGQEIADFAKPLGVAPQNLSGYGPQDSANTSDTLGKHVVFLFADQTIQRVIAAYAEYLCDVFSKQELQDGDFTVVAGVHRPGENDKLPRFLGQYWFEYDPELTGSEPKPTTLYQYIMAGRARAEKSGEAHHVVERLAEGIIRYIQLSNPTADLGNRKRKHRHVVELLADKPEARANYLNLVTCLAADRMIPSLDDWNSRWLPVITAIAEFIGGSQIDSARSGDFLEWPLSAENDVGANPRQRDNVFRHPAESPKAQLRVGSIHSVKGETHTATLVLETFYFKHHLATLKPWLLGKRAGKGNESPQNQSRLKQHYVAMTRPTHLLCLAMREDAFTDEEIVQLKTQRWRVARVTDAAPVWL